jgi:hypothetical protein
MKRQLSFSCLLLLVTFTSFAQNIIKYRDRSVVATNKVNSTKAPVKVTEQAKTENNNPIPGVGVVVKRPPGGGESKVGTTDKKGEVVFTIKEKGDYTFTLSNKGPVKNAGVGVITEGKTRKIIAASTTNDKGEAEFKALPPGTYTLGVQSNFRYINSNLAKGNWHTQ